MHSGLITALAAFSGSLVEALEHNVANPQKLIPVYHSPVCEQPNLTPSRYRFGR